MENHPPDSSPADAEPVLSEAARSVWAKSPDEETGAWLPLWQHMDDAADVAGKLFDVWLPRQTVRLLATDFEGDIEQTRTAVRWLAGIHDLGKATPAFAVQCEALAQRMREHELSMLSKNELVGRTAAHHSVAGQRVLLRWLVEQGWDQATAQAWGVVLGSHHGVPPDDLQLQGADPDIVPHLYGAGRWGEVRAELLTRETHRVGATGYLESWRGRKLSQQFQVLATGLVIVADWIASNTSFFPYHPAGLATPDPDEKRISAAWQALRFPAPWPLPPELKETAELFSARFQLPEGATIRPVQRAAIEAADELTEPGLLIIEAPMGEGKTETALACAEKQARRWGAGGVFVALPTQATTDAMFARVMEWLDRLGAGDSDISGAITLSHGKAKLNRVFQGLIRAGGRPSGIDLDEENPGGNRSVGHAVVAHSWLSGRKRGQLANFDVGTIDQLLFAGLKARHVMLRHLSLAGKVVIIDEIHAYDTFMSSYLAKVLTWLGAYRVPVIALSATLPADRRAELLAAYRGGQQLAAGLKPDAETAAIPADAGYPLLSWCDAGQVSYRVAEPSGRATTVAIDQLPDGLDELDDLLAEQLAGGGTALVVRNTVRRVLAAADHLERRFPGEVAVAHSRFIALERVANDEALLDAFGSPERAVARPHRRIVVASQVVEQSLDVDFDLLVTDLAPVDLVLQRMGRLHRHQRGAGQAQRPPKLRTAQAWITGADFTQNPPKLDRGARDYVYNAYTLLRSAAVLAPRFGGVIELPTDISPLVQTAYGAASIGPDEWADALADAERKLRDDTRKKNDKAKTFQLGPPKKPGQSLVGWLNADVGDADDEKQGQGQVRDTEPSLEAMLVQVDPAGQWYTPAWLPAEFAGLPIPNDAEPAWATAEVMAKCIIRLPREFSYEWAEAVIWDLTPEPWDDSKLINRLPCLLVDEAGFGEIGGGRVKYRYTQLRGLEVLHDERV